MLSRLTRQGQTIERLKDKIRELTQRSQPIPLEQRVDKITQYLKGWLGYFALADMKKWLLEIDKWIRYRLRMCVWKQWKKVRTRIRNFRAHGAPEWIALGYGNTRKGHGLRPYFLIPSLRTNTGKSLDSLASWTDILLFAVLNEPPYTERYGGVEVGGAIRLLLDYSFSFDGLI